MPFPFLVAIEGLVGTGKSTTLLEIESFKIPGIAIRLEPGKDFGKYKNYKTFDLCFNAPSQGNLLALQHHIITSTIAWRNTGEIEEEGSILFEERSILSPIIFINTFYKLGYFSSFSSTYLLDQREFLSKGSREPDLLIYLKIKPDIAYERMFQRGKEIEKKFYDKNYMNALASAHEDFFSMLKKPYIIIDVEGLSPEIIAKTILLKVQEYKHYISSLDEPDNMECS